VFFGQKEISGPISFTGYNGVWNITDGKVVVVFVPELYVKSDGTLVLGGLFASYVPNPAAKGASVMVSRDVSVVPEIPVTVTGTIRFPEDQWKVAGAGLYIKGGGLQFDETGAFLIPGTKYVKDVQ
jgi:hypothetical protein